MVCGRFADGLWVDCGGLWGWMSCAWFVDEFDGLWMDSEWIVDGLGSRLWVYCGWIAGGSWMVCGWIVDGWGMGYGWFVDGL